MADVRKRVYSREQADAILARAVERQHATDTLTHEELLSTAREAGVSAEALEAAARELTDEREEREAERRVRRGLRSAFFNHLTSYVCVIAFLAAINALTWTGMYWFLFPALGWGIGLALHARAALFPSERRVEKLLEREARRASRKRLARRVEAIADGVTARVADRVRVPADAEEDDEQGVTGGEGSKKARYSP